MTITKLLMLIIAVSVNTVLAQNTSKNDPDFPTSEYRYLGQKPPGLIPELFAPGIVSTEEYVESGAAFTPDMREFYFTRYGGKYKKPTLFIVQYKNHKWGRDSLLTTEIDRYKDRFTPGWSEMKRLDAFKDINVHGFSVSASGTYFIDEYTREGNGPLRYSRLVNGEYELPKPAAQVINTGKWVAHPFIAPDESYLMWDVETEGMSTPDIYISFRQKDGSWGAAINMGTEINTAAYEQRPRVTPDGKYLFFWRGDRKVQQDGSSHWVGNPYWVDAKIIETLRPKYSLKESDFPPLENRYFGEKPPGLTPKLFAPDIVSPEGLFEGGTFSPDMKEYYFSRKNGKYKKRTFFIIRYENGHWGSEFETDIKWPQFSADGNIMYVGKEYRERTDTGWSEVKSRGEFLKDQAHGTSLSSNGTCYFGFYKKEDEGKGSIRYSRLINGKRENPVKMSAEINTGNEIAHPYIAPDESYLMWDVVREDGYSGSDIYISFRAKDGTWMPAMNMGDAINTELQESSPGLSPDGKYLFFSRGEWKVKKDGSTYWVGKPYWVDAQVIENLRPENIEHPIAYGSNGICLTNSEGTSKIRLTSGDHGYPAWSPDGKRLAFYGYYDGGKTWSIHTINSDGTDEKRLTDVKGKWDNMPSWSPDGSKIVFAREYKDSEDIWHPEIWIMNADGSEQAQIKSISGGGPCFTPDGKLLFHSEYKDKESEISIADIDGGNIIHLTNNDAEEWDAKVSPDGKQIAFTSDRDGNHEVYVMNIDGSGQTRLTNNDVNDYGPSWSADGSQIVYQSKGDGAKKDDKSGLYIMNKDGSSKRRIVSEGWQPAWFTIK